MHIFFWRIKPFILVRSIKNYSRNLGTILKKRFWMWKLEVSHNVLWVKSFKNIHLIVLQWYRYICIYFLQLRTSLGHFVINVRNPYLGIYHRDIESISNMNEKMGCWGEDVAVWLITKEIFIRNLIQNVKDNWWWFVVILVF